LFFTQRGVLFGLHQHKFNISHFSRWLNHIKPCRTAAIGTVSSLPISLNALSIILFITFIRLLYQPYNFSTDIIGWNQIKDLAMTWGFVNITLMAMQKMQTVGSKHRSTIRWFPLRTTVLKKYWEEEIVDDNSA
jgi:predicted membrane protein